MTDAFLEGVDAREARWRDAAGEKGVSAAYYWIGRGRDALEVAYGTAEAKPSMATIRKLPFAVGLRVARRTRVDPACAP